MFHLVYGTKIPGEQSLHGKYTFYKQIFLVFLQLKDVAIYRSPFRHHIHQWNYSDSLHILVFDLSSAQNYWNKSLIAHQHKISPNSPCHLFDSNLGSWAMDLVPNHTKGITLKTLKEQEQTLDVKEFMGEVGLNSCFLMQ